MEPMNRKIYTVTMFQKIDRLIINDDTGAYLPDFGERRCVGYFTDLKRAFEAVTNNEQNIYENFYKYCVIESYEPGLFPLNLDRYFFEWQENTYIQIDEPIEVNKVCNFSIG